MICNEELNDPLVLPDPTPEFNTYYLKCLCFEGQENCYWKRLGCAKVFQPVIGCGVPATLLRLCDLDAEDIPLDMPYFRMRKG